MPILLNDMEREALRGLIYMARESYVFGIRPFMDYASGIVGIARGISYQSIAEELYVEPHQGIKSHRPTEKELRHAIDWLERAGLLERSKDANKRDRKLVFRLPLATTDKFARKKVGSKWADEVGSQERSNDAALQGKVGSTKTPKVGIPPLSDISNTPHTRARAKRPISESWQPSERCYELIQKAEIPRSFADQCIDEFVMYWTDSQEKRASWDATFLNRVKDQWARAKENPEGERGQPGSSNTTRGSHHETNRRGYQSAVSRQEEAARRHREKRQAEGAYDEPKGNVIEGQFCRVKG